MEIKTKFDIGQKIYYIQHTKQVETNEYVPKIACAYVSGVYVDEHLFITYELGWFERRFYESSLFATLEEVEQKLKELEE